MVNEEIIETLVKYTRASDLDTDFYARRTLMLGDQVYVDLHRGACWIGHVAGRFAGYTKSGRARVFSHEWRGCKIFDPINVTRRTA